jgi:hypothetical protein
MAKGFTSTLTCQQKTIGVSNPTDLLNVSFLNHFETTPPRIERSKEHLRKDYERLVETSETFIYIAMIRIMVRRLA